jgi:hypothetical protein
VSGSALQTVRSTKYRRNIYLAPVGPVWIPQKCVGTPDAKFLFLHPVVSVAHVAHSGASGARTIDALFFMLKWDQCSFHKKARRDMVCRTCVIASGGICRLRSALRCIRA